MDGKYFLGAIGILSIAGIECFAIAYLKLDGVMLSGVVGTIAGIIGAVAGVSIKSKTE